MSLTKTHDDPELLPDEEIPAPPPPPVPPAKFKPVNVSGFHLDKPLSAEAAEALVLAIKGNSEHYRQTAAEIRRLLVMLYKGEGWVALGYLSWRKCVLAEFDQSSQAELYRALHAGLVEGEMFEGGLDPATVLPESHLLALGKLPEGQKLPTYEEALQAVEDGQALSTEKVQQIVANKLGIDAGDGTEVYQEPAGNGASPDPKTSKKAAKQKTCQMLRELIIAIVHERKTATREELAQSAVELLTLLEDL